MAGMWTNGAPAVPIPLTGLETIPIDTNATQGIAPESGGITTAQLLGIGAPVALTDAATITTNAALGRIFSVTLGGNRTLANPTNLTVGATYTWVITQDATGSRTLAFGTLFLFSAGSKTLSTAANAVDVITGIYNGTNILCDLNKAYA